MKTSLQSRYLFTLTISIFRALVSFTTGIILARKFGPIDYGKMVFITGTFLALRSLIDLGTSQAFFTFMSNEKKTRKFVNTYFIWLLMQMLLTLIFISLIMPKNLIQMIWHGEDQLLIILAFFAIFFQNSVWPSIQQALESQRSTFISQIISLIIVIIHICMIFLLWTLKQLSLYNLFVLIFIEYLVAFFISYRFLTFSNEYKTNNIDDTKIIFINYLNYCKPLIVYSIISFLYSFFDNWFLQNFSGNINQAHYAVSNQIAGVTLLFTISITNIFFKEIAEAYYKKDFDRVSAIYLKVTHIIFVVSSIISCFFIPWSKEILNLLLGKSYIDGYITLSIMLLYPIHQSLGQISGSLLLATNNVMLHTKIGIIFMIISILFSYFLLAPNSYFIPGLNLGSKGLAIKMFILQFFQVNIMIFYISKILKINFNFKFQFIVMSSLLSISFFTHFIASFLFIEKYNFILTLISSLFFYIISVLIFILFFPVIIGVKKKSIKDFFNNFITNPKIIKILKL